MSAGFLFSGLLLKERIKTGSEKDLGEKTWRVCIMNGNIKCHLTQKKLVPPDSVENRDSRNLCLFMSGFVLCGMEYAKLYFKVNINKLYILT